MHEVENVTTVPSCWFRHFYARRLPERSARPSSSRWRLERRGETVRKIVTAKDFEFSPRKESAAAEPAKPSFPCMCMHYACTTALWEKCLGSREARGGCLVSMYAALPARYIVGKCTYRHTYDIARSFTGDPLIAPIRFPNDACTRHPRCQAIVACKKSSFPLPRINVK